MRPMATCLLSASIFLSPLASAEPDDAPVLPPDTNLIIETPVPSPAFAGRHGCIPMLISFGNYLWKCV